MPIGENAVKRVENNGYSKVRSSCPDMENSVVAEEPKAPAKKAAPKKNAEKREERVLEKNGFERVSFGDEMPYWLL